MKLLGWAAIIIVYLLTLATQLPHIYDVYSALERSEHDIAGLDTALGASIAFEASVAIFTLRTIINRKKERSKWTRPGIVFFLLLSVLANTSYYFDVALVDSTLMPGALTVAIPLALWLYAEEFGAEAKVAIREQRKAAQAPATATRIAAQADATVAQHECWCGEKRDTQQGLAAHTKRHKNEARAAESLPDALAAFERLYPSSNGGPSTEQVIEWRK
jgi:hypothetical protein